MTATEVRLALSELNTLALTIFGEARGEEIEGKIAVASVIRNRARDPKRWPDDIKGVCLEKSQFSCWSTAGGAANYRTVMELAEKLVTMPAYIPEPMMRECQWIAEGILSGVVRSRVGGANHYMTRQRWETNPLPKWAKGQRPTAFVLRHVFFLL